MDDWHVINTGEVLVELFESDEAREEYDLEHLWVLKRPIEDVNAGVDEFVEETPEEYDDFEELDDKDFDSEAWMKGL